MEKKREVKFSKDELYAILIRMWMAGAMFLLFAMGTSIAESDDYYIPLIMTLGIAITAASLIIINPVIKSSLKTRLNRNTKGYLEIPLVKKIIKNVGYGLVNITIVFLISLVYWALNKVIVIIDSSWYIAPAPIIFSLLYGLFYKIYELITDIFYKKN